MTRSNKKVESNIKPDDIKVKSQTLFLNNKRDRSPENKSINNNDKKGDNFLKAPVTQILLSPNLSKNQVNIPQFRNAHNQTVSSKSLLKANIFDPKKSERAINETASNNRLELKEYSAVNQFAKTPSQISLTHSQIRKRTKLNTQFNFSDNFKTTTGEIDYKLLLKLFSGTLSVYAFAYCLHSKIINVEQIIDCSLNTFYNNKENILFYGLIAAASCSITLLFFYLKNKIEYSGLCQEAAKRSVNKVIEILKDQLEEDNMSCIEEEALIALLASDNDMSEDQFKKNVYKPYLINLLQENPNLSTKELINEGEINFFWVYKENNEYDDVLIEDENN